MPRCRQPASCSCPLSFSKILGCLPAGYLSVAHYLVLNKAGGLEAKRAALASGFCPPDLEGGRFWLHVGDGLSDLPGWLAGWLAGSRVGS